MSIITISHEAFGDSRAVAERVAAILGYRCISREVLIEASQRYGIAEAKFFEISEEKPHIEHKRSGGFYPDRKAFRYVRMGNELVEGRWATRLDQGRGSACVRP